MENAFEMIITSTSHKQIDNAWSSSSQPVSSALKFDNVGPNNHYLVRESDALR